LLPALNSKVLLLVIGGALGVFKENERDE